MGHVSVKASITGLKASEKVEVLVDTGATHSMLPANLAKRIEVVETPLREEVKLADGSLKQLPVGLCYLEVAGRRVVSKILIGSDEPIMGVLDMEAMGIRVDPVTGTVEFTRGYAARA